MEIEWKKIKWSDKYSISSDGQVRNDNTGFIFKKCKNNSGYFTVSLYSDSKTISCFIHRLIYENFIGEIPEGSVINHKDSNRLNNTITNLELVTSRENNNHRYIKNSETGVIGVTKQFRNNGKYEYYEAHINFNNILHRKLFNTSKYSLQDAIDWRKQKEIEFGLSDIKYLTNENILK